MQCPIDGETLVISERSGVEIDYCPKCRGVWLDRGELDKIMDRAAGEFSKQNEYGQQRPASHAHQEQSYRHEHSDEQHRYSQKSRKKSFLSEIFEFGD